jgi:hypothetical protein
MNRQITSYNIYYVSFGYFSGAIGEFCGAIRHLDDFEVLKRFLGVYSLPAD